MPVITNFRIFSVLNGRIRDKEKRFEINLNRWSLYLLDASVNETKQTLKF